MASEVGVANVGVDEVVQKGRLKPGRLLLVDTQRGVIVKDEIIKEEIATLRPVANWIEQEVSYVTYTCRFWQPFLLFAHSRPPVSHTRV